MVNNKENYKFDLGVEGLTNERGPENEHQKKKKKVHNCTRNGVSRV